MICMSVWCYDLCVRVVFLFVCLGGVGICVSG